MLKNGFVSALIFQEIDFFEHLKYNFKTSWPQKDFNFQKIFYHKNYTYFNDQKIPLTVLDVKK